MIKLFNLFVIIIIIIKFFHNINAISSNDNDTNLTTTTPWKVKNRPSKNHYQRKIILRRSLLNEKYDNKIIPISKPLNYPLPVSIDLFLIQLVRLNEIDQQMVAHIWLRETWRDERLDWSKDKRFRDIESLRVYQEDIWTPDIYLHNSASANSEEDERIVPIILYKNGTLQWTRLIVSTSSCEMHLNYFPFDVQRCFLKFGSWTNPKEIIDLKMVRDEINLSEYVRNNMWDIVGQPITRDLEKSHSQASRFKNEDENHHTEKVIKVSGNKLHELHLTFNMIFVRDPRKYVVNIIVPCIIFGALCILTFYLPPNGDRLSLSLSILVSISVFQVLVLDFIPRATDTTPILTIFLTVLLVMVFISIIFATVIIRLNQDDLWEKEMNVINDCYFYFFYSTLPICFPYLKKCPKIMANLWESHQIICQLKIRLKEEQISDEPAFAMIRKNISMTSVRKSNDKLQQLNEELGQIRRSLRKKETTTTTADSSTQEDLESQPESSKFLENEHEQNDDNKEESKFYVSDDDKIKFRQLLKTEWEYIAMYVNRVCTYSYTLGILTLNIWFFAHVFCVQEQIEQLLAESFNTSLHDHGYGPGH